MQPRQRKSATSAGHSAAKRAFVRAAIEHEITGGGAADKLTCAEERIAANMKQLRREMYRLGRAQQALFAYVDSLAKVL